MIFFNSNTPEKTIKGQTIQWEMRELFKSIINSMYCDTNPHGC